MYVAVLSIAKPACKGAITRGSGVCHPQKFSCSEIESEGI